jgi:hypothetical protein
LKFYFPDSQDQVSPTFDFLNEEYSPFRVRQRDDQYAHEVLTPAPYDGLLVSKAMVDGTVKGAGKYSEPQRSRLYRYGARRFFRLPDGVSTLGDCGAFNYVNEEVPPHSVGEVADFYEGCRLDAGVSVDHVILGYNRDAGLRGAPKAWKVRRDISLRYAEDFLSECDRRGRPFEPVGAAQGWDPESYTDSVARLQAMGYNKIALGGMVPLKTPDIVACLESIAEVRREEVDLHLLGVTRFDSMEVFKALGVTSFDSTSPFRQAFMDDLNNYHTESGHYTAIRVPQVDANPAVKRLVLSGELDQRTLLRAESACLSSLRAVNSRKATVDAAVDALEEYEQLLRVKRGYSEEYRATLTARPWRHCICTLCMQHGIEIAIFRGAERNKRRGFHNLAILNRRMHGQRQMIEGAA